MECQTTKAHIYKQSFSLKKGEGAGDNNTKTINVFFSRHFQTQKMEKENNIINKNRFLLLELKKIDPKKSLGKTRKWNKI